MLVDEGTLALTNQERLVLEQEQRLLGRVQASLAQARAAHAQANAAARLRPDAIEVVRALRSEAATASADDLPALLHELSVRQTLLARPAADRLPAADSPYIAHLTLREAGKERDYFLAQHTHLDGAAGVRVVDWRVAPVARIFYGYREGDEYEEEYPGRVAEGTVVARRIVVIEHGELIQLVSDGFVLERGAGGVWRSQARANYALGSGGAGNAVRADALTSRPGARAPAITALLDAAQFAAISAPPEQPLLVLGSAGSGKTTVALHRLARSAALDPKRYPLELAQVIVPEEGLARLSRRLLAPLGVGQTRVHTLDQWALSLARTAFAARLPQVCSETPALVTSLKRHPALYRALGVRFMRAKPSKAPTLKRLRRQLGELFSDAEFLAGVVDAAQGTLSRASVSATVQHTLLQLADSVEKQTAAVTDRSRLRTLDGQSIAAGTPEALAQTLDIEDFPIFLAILAWQGALPPAPASQLVLDEAEDFSLFDLFVLGTVQGEHKCITLAGDEAQQTSSSFAGFEPALAEFGASHAAVCRLAVSYRCPKPIFELARTILGPLANPSPQSAARDGAPVGQFAFPNADLATLFCVGELGDLVQREPEASIAVIAHDADAARRFHALLPEFSQARLVLSGEFSFEPGIDVTDLDNVKGLEFDYVIVPQASEAAYPTSDESRRRLHVAVTRAVSRLWLVSGGEPSHILPHPPA
jgi:DNA helicase-2/ATP-dependent DNA helicase PcrA